MADFVSEVLDFIATHPGEVLLLSFLMLFVFGVYLFIRKTVKEFRKGLEG